MSLCIFSLFFSLEHYYDAAEALYGSPVGYAPEMCIVCAQEIEDRGCKEGGVGEEEGECVGGLVLGGGLLRGIRRHGWCTGGRGGGQRDRVDMARSCYEWRGQSGGGRYIINKAALCGGGWRQPTGRQGAPAVYKIAKQVPVQQQNGYLPCGKSPISFSAKRPTGVFTPCKT